MVRITETYTTTKEWVLNPAQEAEASKYERGKVEQMHEKLGYNTIHQYGDPQYEEWVKHECCRRWWYDHYDSVGEPEEEYESDGYTEVDVSSADEA